MTMFIVHVSMNIHRYIYIYICMYMECFTGLTYFPIVIEYPIDEVNQKEVFKSKHDKSILTSIDKEHGKSTLVLSILSMFSSKNVNENNVDVNSLLSRSFVVVVESYAIDVLFVCLYACQ
jgi:hypothetical protein